MSSKHEPPSQGDIDPSICPLCGGPNDCASARGESSCWCETAVIPFDVLARVPKEIRARACVCRKCAGLAGDQASDQAGEG